jgi:hypothetical protein
MELVLLTIAISILIPIFHIVLINILRIDGLHIKLMFVSFLLYIFVGIIITQVIFQGSDEIIMYYITSLSTSVFMCLFYMEAFSMVARGFSMRIVTDLFRQKSLSPEKLMEDYADGKGINWMLEKRINGIKSLNLIAEQSDKIALSSNYSFFIAYISLNFKKILRLGRGG